MKTNTNKVFLSTAYLPNIQYFSKLLLHDVILIEVNDTFQKQSFRNRCSIYSANGSLDLTIPVIKPNGNRTVTKDILIDNGSKWQQEHWRAIKSAYGHSPFFEIFEPELLHLFEEKEEYLIDYNTKVLIQLLNCIGSTVKLTFTSEFQSITDYEFDYRDSIHPKKRMQKEDKHFSPIPYLQVFSEKYGFIPNLSFLDLMFNEGPQAIGICRNCINTVN